jgi:hypothetical protein
MDQANYSTSPNFVQPEQKPQADTLRTPEQMSQKEIAQELRQRLTNLRALRQAYLRGEIGPNANVKRAVV